MIGTKRRELFVVGEDDGDLEGYATYEAGYPEEVDPPEHNDPWHPQAGTGFVRRKGPLSQLVLLSGLSGNSKGRIVEASIEEIVRLGKHADQAYVRKTRTARHTDTEDMHEGLVTDDYLASACRAAPQYIDLGELGNKLGRIDLRDNPNIDATYSMEGDRTVFLEAYAAVHGVMQKWTKRFRFADFASVFVSPFDEDQIAFYAKRGDLIAQVQSFVYNANIARACRQEISLHDPAFLHELDRRVTSAPEEFLAAAAYEAIVYNPLREHEWDASADPAKRAVEGVVQYVLNREAADGVFSGDTFAFRLQGR